MSQSIAILGRQPALGLAELESLFGAEALQPVGEEAVVINLPTADIPFARIGGSMKLGKYLTRLDTTDWRKISDYLVQEVPKHTCCIPEGKVTFGISVNGLKTNVKAIERTALSVKKAVKKDGRPIRVVPNKSLELNSAQVLHNKMTVQPHGMELLLIRDGNSTILAQTTAVQDIEAYAARDQKRPKRDSKVGMLPPKLAQIITNLSIGDKKDQQLTLLDPFCGTGVLLQEAFLMGLSIYGTDIEPRMVEYANVNLDWLNEGTESSWKLEVGDATSHDWSSFDALAAETYLGRPFSAEPDPATLQQVMSDVNTIHKKFLQNLAKQTGPGFRACLAVPAWFTRSGTKHLKVLDSLEELGYNRLSFVHAEAQDLIYHRKGQIVGRELVVLQRK